MTGGYTSLWLQGALHVQLRGDEAAQIVTMLQRRGHTLRRVRVYRKTATLIIPLSDFSDLYILCRRHHVKMRFIERIGLVFWLKKVRRRKSMVLGPLLFVAILYIASSLIWQVSVTGVSEDTAAAIRDAAADAGISVGAWRWSVGDLTAVQDRVLAKVPSLIWVGATMNGSTAKLEAIEKVPGTDEKPLKPQDIVAKQPGVIEYVYATRGKVVVKSGQVVRPGDVLITGNLSEDGTQVPAQGKVMAEVWYTSRIILPLKVPQSGLTGESVGKDYLVFGNLPVRIWGWKATSYQDAVEQTVQSEWRVGDVQLPIQYRHVEMEETTKSAYTLSRRQAASKAQALALQDVQGRIGSEGTLLEQRILHQKVSHGKLYETVLTKVEQDIGAARAIPKVEPQKQTNDG